MDVHVRRAVTTALRLHAIDVLTAQEDGPAELSDDVSLKRATELGRVLVSQDEDLLREGATWLSERKDFSGIIYRSGNHARIDALIQQTFVGQRRSLPRRCLNPKPIVALTRCDP